METSNPPIVIPPLTCRTEDGKLYVRHEAVDAELRTMLPLAAAEWPRVRPRPQCESLVFLTRYIRHRDDYVAGQLHDELRARTFRMSRCWIYGIYQEATDYITAEVESEIAVLLLAEVPSRQSEYLEVAFGQTVHRHTINAVNRFKNTPLAHKALPHKTLGEDGGMDPIQRQLESLADGRAGADEILLEGETETLWAAWVQRALRFVTNPKHREAVILRYLKQWPITDEDPEKSCLTRHFKISARQIQNWIDIALKQMKERMIGEGYDRTKSGL